MHLSEERFVRLARLARHALDDAAHDELPPALAARTLAQIRSGQPIGRGNFRIRVATKIGSHSEGIPHTELVASPWERLALPAVTLAAIAATACVILSSRVLQIPPSDERALAQLIVETQLKP